MALAEKQSGSDVLETATTAYCDNKDERRYILIGHKYEKIIKCNFFHYIVDGFVLHQ